MKIIECSNVYSFPLCPAPNPNNKVVSSTACDSCLSHLSHNYDHVNKSYQVHCIWPMTKEQYFKDCGESVVDISRVL